MQGSIQLVQQVQVALVAAPDKVAGATGATGVNAGSRAVSVPVSTSNFHADRWSPPRLVAKT